MIDGYQVVSSLTQLIAKLIEKITCFTNTLLGLLSIKIGPSSMFLTDRNYCTHKFTGAEALRHITSDGKNKIYSSKQTAESRLDFLRENFYKKRKQLKPSRHPGMHL